jgi:hypothetical protein
MRPNQKRPRIEHEDLEAIRLPETEDLVSAIAAEHARANHDGVERARAARGRFVPGVADEPAKHVDAKRSALDIGRRRDRLAGIEQAVEGHGLKQPPRLTNRSTVLLTHADQAQGSCNQFVKLHMSSLKPGAGHSIVPSHRSNRLHHAPNGKTVTTLSLATKTSYLNDGDRQGRD